MCFLENVANKNFVEFLDYDVFFNLCVQNHQNSKYGFFPSFAQFWLFELFLAFKKLTVLCHRNSPLKIAFLFRSIPPYHISAPVTFWSDCLLTLLLWSKCEVSSLLDSCWLRFCHNEIQKSSQAWKIHFLNRSHREGLGNYLSKTPISKTALQIVTALHYSTIFKHPCKSAKCFVWNTFQVFWATFQYSNQ